MARALGGTQGGRQKHGPCLEGIHAEVGGGKTRWSQTDKKGKQAERIGGLPRANTKVPRVLMLMVTFRYKATRRGTRVGMAGLRGYKEKKTQNEPPCLKRNLEGDKNLVKAHTVSCGGWGSRNGKTGRGRKKEKISPPGRARSCRP